LPKRERSFSAAKEARTSLSDPVEQIPAFVLDSFAVEDEPCDEDPAAVEKNGSVLLPLRRKCASPKPKEEPEPVEPEPEPEENPQDRIDAMERDAYEKGFAQGQQDGLAIEKRHMEENAKQLDEILKSLDALKGQIYRETEEEMVRLSMAIAGKVIRKELRTGKQIIGETIRAAMKLLVDASQVRIRVSPEDMEEVERILPSVAAGAKAGRVQILEDQGLTKGGCVLQTGFGSVNATVEDQMALVEKEIERVLSADEGSRR
jgi:flagellar assembly protein FliH